MLAIDWDTAHVVSIPMRLPFRGITTREALLLQGPAGWGEFSPFTEYGDVESARWLAATLEAAYDGFPAAVRNTVAVNATVPAVQADDVAAVLARFPGCTTAKVKVAQAGQLLGEDVDRVAAVRSFLGATGRVRIDANAAWTLDEAIVALRALAPFDLEYAEQPCAELADLAALRVALARAGIEMLIAADESVRKASDPLQLALSGAADVVVLKVAPLSGVRAALAVARECGLPVVVSSALDTSVGISAGVALAAALPSLPYACGLATSALFAADVAELVPVQGALRVGPVTPDPARLAELAAPPARRAWWVARARRCQRLLEESAP